MTIRHNNLAKLLLMSIDKYHSRPLIRNNNITYNCLYKLSNNYLQYFNDIKLKPGSRICITEEKSIDFIAIMLAAWRNNNIFVPINNSNENLIEMIKPSIKFTNEMINSNSVYRHYQNNNYKRYNFMDIDKIKSDDPALILYTSGSTTISKGVVLSHNNIMANLEMIDKKFNNEISRYDTSYSILPWYHCYGLVCELLYLMSKGSSIYLPTKSTLKNRLIEMRNSNPTLLYTVPKMLEMIYKNTDKYMKWIPSKVLKKRILFNNNLRMMSVGGSICNPYLIEYYKENYDIPVYQGYGMTETSPMISLNSKIDNKLLSVGKVFDGIDIKFDSNGQILIKSPTVMLGYVDYIDENNKIRYKSKDDYFETGDCGVLDDDKYLYITGRIKSKYKLSNGIYTDPAYVESLILLSPNIEQVFVYPDENNEYNKCLVYTNLDSEKRILQEIEKYTKNLSIYEIPKSVIIMKERFSVENDCLSLKLDLKRNNIIRKYNL